MPGDLARYLPAFLRTKAAGLVDVSAVINNTGWLLFDRLIRMLLGLLVGAWVARYLGPAQFGELAYVIAFVAFFQAIVSLGTDGIVVRDIVRNPDMAPLLLGTAFALRVSTGVVCWFAAVGGMIIMNGVDDPRVVLTALVAGAVVFQAVDIVDLWFQSQSQSRRTVLAKLAAYFISNACKVYLILIHAPLVSFAAVMALDFLASALALAVAYRGLRTSSRWEVRWSLARELISHAWPFALSGVAIIAYVRIDQLVIGQILGGSALGVYSAALSLSQLWQFVPMTVATSLAPYLARKKAQSEQAYDATLQRMFRLFALMAILIAIVVALLAPALVEKLYGAQYSSAVGVLQVHVVSNVFLFLGVAQGLWLINEGLAKLSLYKAAIGALVSIAGNLLLVPHYGIMAAAVVTVIAQFLSSVVSNAIFAKKIFRMQTVGMFASRP